MAQYLEDIQNEPSVVREIVRQYEQKRHLWSDQLAEGLARATPVFTGMGSSLFAGAFAAYSLLEAGVWATAHDASELLQQGIGAISDTSVLFAVSQSGKSLETRQVVERVQGRLRVASLTNCADSPIAEASDVHFELHAGEEAGVATKTYIASLAALSMISTLWTGMDSAETGARLLSIADSMESFLRSCRPCIQCAAELLDSAQAIAVVGSGYDYLTALQGALTLKEAAHVFTESLSTGQFFHGSIEGLGKDSCGIVLATQPAGVARGAKLARTMSQYGGRVVMITQSGKRIRLKGLVQVELPCELDRLGTPFGSILALQVLAAELAKARGLEPGVFQRVSKIVDTE